METKDYNDYCEMVSKPGKFEGEQPYIPYFWQQYLNGWENETVYDNDVQYSLYEIENEDRIIFPELKDIFGIALWEDNNGFVNSIDFESAEDYYNFIDDFEDFEDFE